MNEWINEETLSGLSLYTSEGSTYIPFCNDSVLQTTQIKRSYRCRTPVVHIAVQPCECWHISFFSNTILALRDRSVLTVTSAASVGCRRWSSFDRLVHGLFEDISAAGRRRCSYIKKSAGSRFSCCSSWRRWIIDWRRKPVKQTYIVSTVHWRRSRYTVYSLRYTFAEHRSRVSAVARWTSINVTLKAVTSGLRLWQHCFSTSHLVTVIVSKANRIIDLDEARSV